MRGKQRKLATLCLALATAPIAGGMAAAQSYTAFDPATASPGLTLSNGNLTISQSDSSSRMAVSAQGYATGKYYWEFQFNFTYGLPVMGAGVAIFNDASNQFHGGNENIVAYNDGSACVSNVCTSFTAAFLSTDVLGIAVDAGGKTVGFNKNGGSFTTVSGSAAFPFASAYFHPAALDAATSPGTANFGTTPLAFSPPGGYTAGWPVNPPVGAFAAWNATYGSAANVLYDGNQTVWLAPSGNGHVGQTASFCPSSGKYYAEITFFKAITNFYDAQLGIARSPPPYAFDSIFSTASAIGMDNTGDVNTNGSAVIALNGGTQVTTPGLGEMAIDVTDRRGWWRVPSAGSGYWNNSAGASPTSPSTGYDLTTVLSGQPACVAFVGTASTSFGVVNLGNTPFSDTVPSGYTGWPLTGGAADSGDPGIVQ